MNKCIKLVFAVMLLIFCAPVFAINAKGAQNMNKDDYQMLNLDWWKKFGDENLIKLLLTAYENNQDLKIAELNVKEAEQTVKMSFSRELPELSFNGSYGREFESSQIQFGNTTIPNYNQSRFILPLNMSYEFDIWGKNHLKTKSLKVQQKIIEQDKRALYISLTSAIASDYFNLITLNNLIENQKRLVQLQKDIVKMEEKKYASGLCSVHELIYERQALTFFQAELNDFSEKYDVVKNNLYTLLGNENSNLVLNNDFILLNAPEALEPDIIQNRPDLIKTADYIEKSRLDVRIAKKDFLPSFLLYGQIGFNAYQLNKIFTPTSWLSNVGVSPSVDLFTGGLKTSVLKFKKYEYDKSLQYYKKAILTSVQEVNDSLFAAKTADKNYQEMSENLSLEDEIYNLSEKQLKIGAKSELEHKKNEQALLIARKNERGKNFI